MPTDITSAGSSAVTASRLPPFPCPTTDATGATKWRYWKQLWEAEEGLSDLGSKTSKYRKSAFVSAAGIDGLEIINTLPFEQDEDREDVDKILQLLDEHFLGAENVRYERFCFYQRNQKPDEDILTFIGDLRALSRTCKFVKVKTSQRK